MSKNLIKISNKKIEKNFKKSNNLVQISKYQKIERKNFKMSNNLVQVSKCQKINKSTKISKIFKCRIFKNRTKIHNCQKRTNISQFQKT